MEINRTNFKDRLPIIEKAIDEADFCAIDCEFTGIHNGREPSQFDTPAQYYTKKRNGSSNFLILQLGLATFRLDIATGIYKTSCFNFYIFPFPVPGVVRSVTYEFQSSCMSFLASVGFDFNKVFHEGISFISRADEATQRDQLTEKRKKRYENIGGKLEYQPINIPQEDQAQIDDICERIQTFLETAQPNDELVLGQYNSFIRRIIHNNVGYKFRGKVVFDIKNANDCGNLLTVVAYLRGDKKCQQIREDEKQLEEDRILEDAIGVAFVIRRISESGKLIIGHNMFLDLMHITSHFMQSLPSSYQLFKDLVNCCFPNIIDTKYLASCAPFKDKVKSSILIQLIEILGKTPFSLPKIEATEGTLAYEISDDKCHEAAYDAFLTGICFISMADYIGHDGPALTKDSTSLEPYKNRIFVYRLADIPYFRLDGDDPKPNRDHVLYISFPAEWTNKNIENLFSTYSRVNVAWISDTSAYVAMKDGKTAKQALMALAKNTTFKVMSYVKYEALMNAARPLPSKASGVTSPPKRKLCEEIGAAGCLARILGPDDDGDDPATTNTDGAASAKSHPVQTKRSKMTAGEHSAKKKLTLQKSAAKTVTPSTMAAEKLFAESDWE